METVKLSPEEERVADILSNVIGKLIECGVEPRDAASAVVSSLIEVETQLAA